MAPYVVTPRPVYVLPSYSRPYAWPYRMSSGSYVRTTSTGPGLTAAVGGAVGGLIGSQIGHGAGQLAATAAGAVLGYSIGSSIDRSYARE